MNERIKELAKQSGLIAPYGSVHEGLRDFDYRKFAELIVRECIANCDDLNSMKYIADHFGIKIESLE